MKRDRAVAVVSLLGGLLLAVIGVRYLLVPEAATLSFGVGKRPQGHELYYIIGLRNLWLGLLAVAFALLQEWRALALWFAFGAIVCFADAGIAASSVGGLPHIAFHAGCGLACCGLPFLRGAARRNGSSRRPMLVSAIDFGLLLAVLTLGWGIAVAAYRPIAEAISWPMGAPQRRHPQVARSLGLACVVCAVSFVIWRIVAAIRSLPP